MLLVAIIVSPCISKSVESYISNTTLVFSCPKTAKYIWEERPEGPVEHARRLHYWSLPRDDKPPLAVAVQEQPKVEPAKKAKKKTKRKKRKRK